MNGKKIATVAVCVLAFGGIIANTTVGIVSNNKLNNQIADLENKLELEDAENKAELLQAMASAKNEVDVAFKSADLLIKGEISQIEQAMLTADGETRALLQEKVDELKVALEAAMQAGVDADKSLLNYVDQNINELKVALFGLQEETEAYLSVIIDAINELYNTYASLETLAAAYNSLAGASAATWKEFNGETALEVKELSERALTLTYVNFPKMVSELALDAVQAFGGEEITLEAQGAIESQVEELMLVYDTKIYPLFMGATVRVALSKDSLGAYNEMFEYALRINNFSNAFKLFVEKQVERNEINAIEGLTDEEKAAFVELVDAITFDYDSADDLSGEEGAKYYEDLLEEVDIKGDQAKHYADLVAKHTSVVEKINTEVTSENIADGELLSAVKEDYIADCDALLDLEAYIDATIEMLDTEDLDEYTNGIKDEMDLCFDRADFYQKIRAIADLKNSLIDAYSAENLTEDEKGTLKGLINLVVDYEDYREAVAEFTHEELQGYVFDDIVDEYGVIVFFESLANQVDNIFNKAEAFEQLREYRNTTLQDLAGLEMANYSATFEDEIKAETVLADFLLGTNEMHYDDEEFETYVQTLKDNMDELLALAKAEDAMQENHATESEALTTKLGDEYTEELEYLSELEEIMYEHFSVIDPETGLIKEGMDSTTAQANVTALAEALAGVYEDSDSLIDATVKGLKTNSILDANYDSFGAQFVIAYNNENGDGQTVLDNHLDALSAEPYHYEGYQVPVISDTATYEEVISQYETFIASVEDDIVSFDTTIATYKALLDKQLTLMIAEFNAKDAERLEAEKVKYLGANKDGTEGLLYDAYQEAVTAAGDDIVKLGKLLQVFNTWMSAILNASKSDACAVAYNSAVQNFQSIVAE